MSAERIVSVLTESDVTPPVPTNWIQGGACQGSKFHSPTPLMVRPVHLSDVVLFLVGEGEPQCEDEVWLCSTCHDNLTVYVSVLYAYAGATPRSVRRDFGNIVRDLGDRAWQHHLKRSQPSPV